MFLVQCYFKEKKIRAQHLDKKKIFKEKNSCRSKIPPPPPTPPHNFSNGPSLTFCYVVNIKGNHIGH